MRQGVGGREQEVDSSGLMSRTYELKLDPSHTHSEILGKSLNLLSQFLTCKVEVVKTNLPQLLGGPHRCGPRNAHLGGSQWEVLRKWELA